MEKDVDLANDPALDPQERDRQQKGDMNDEGEAEKRRRRTTYVIDRDFQYRFSTSWMALMVLYVVLVGAIFYGATLYIKGGVIKKQAHQFLENLLWYAGAPTVLLTVLFVLYFILLAHRIAGPEYRLNKSLKRIASGDIDFSVQLRSTDYLKSLADRVNEVISLMKDRRDQIRGIEDKVERLHDRLEVEETVSKNDLELCEQIGQELSKLQEISDTEGESGDSSEDEEH